MLLEEGFSVLRLDILKTLGNGHPYHKGVNKNSTNESMYVLDIRYRQSLRDI